MDNVKKIELLSPAKDLNCGIEAVNHGADAVYIGAPKFGARSAAGNTIEDINSLCDYAHIYGVRVYVALNTILKEEELEEARQLAWDLYEAGADALIVQDMALMKLSLPPIPLHASTQTDNRTVEKVRFLQNAGFSQVVLARELTLDEIRLISKNTEVPLEAFVHGALCVSYSGQCYLSAAMNGRSANRGECSQCCRLPYTMVDADGKVIAENKYLLSLRDMNRSENLEDLLDAGITSFKIEGRLKEVSYVKNITALYRQKLDCLLADRKEYRKASDGVCRYRFTPKADKSFNRSFTPFYLRNRIADVTSFDSPKSRGEYIGSVKEIHENYFTVSGTVRLNNGDGLVFFDKNGELKGFRVNKVEENKVFPLERQPLFPKMKLYRNYDRQFETLLSKLTVERKIRVEISFVENAIGFTLEMKDEGGCSVSVVRPAEKVLAKTEQTDNIRNQLSKLGNTPFEANEISVVMNNHWFIPSSVLNDMRRKAVSLLLSARKIRFRRELVRRPSDKDFNSYPERELSYLGNVSNSLARSFYEEHGVSAIDPAFELKQPENVPLMFTKHCLRYSMGWCPLHHKVKSPFKEPYYLLYKDTRLLLKFDCKNCRMLVIKPTNIKL